MKIEQTLLGRAINWLAGTAQMGVLRYYKEPEIVALIQEIRREDRFLFKPSELYMIYSTAKACRDLPGDFAEVGVYRGSSAKMICHTKGEKTLHLFDTFTGLPRVQEIDTRFEKDMFSATSVEIVQKRLEKYANVSVHPGLFPQTGESLKNQQFAFVHIDVDLYESTRDCLEFFYPRLHPGGILLTHDYAQAKGVRTAFDSFFADKPESLIELSVSQCMVVKQ